MRRKTERRIRIKEQNKAITARYAWIKAGRPEPKRLDPDIRCFCFLSWRWFTKKNCRVTSGTFFV
jgi:hypothetical protein